MSPAPPYSLLRRHWALWAVCALFLLAGALAFNDYGVSHTGLQRAIGVAALDYLAGDGERALDRIGTFQDRYYGAAFQAPLVLVERTLGLERERDVYVSRDLLTHLFFLTGGVFCYLLVLRMFGGRALALVAMALFLLHPRIYGFSFSNTQDIPFLAMFMIALYLVHRAFRRDTLAAFLLCGVGVGLLVNLRIMGIVLFVAVLALCALDAGREGGRRRALLTGGAFALAAMLTYHASLPVLWTDPVGRFVELVRTLGAHPNEGFNLFRGEWLYSRDGPPLDYVPVWVGITTPPATLLLALLGALAFTGRALRRPRDILRSGPLRFGLLLIALPVATTVAIVVLESNLYDKWKHLYFLYAPLLLLAVCGLHRLASASREWRLRTGTYALAAAAVAVSVVSMVRIHPHQDNYFNALVDRTTPGRLDSLYAMNYWRRSSKEILDNVIRDHPSGDLFISLDHLSWYQALFPTTYGERIVETRDFRSGERNFLEIAPPVCADPRAPVSYVSRIYATTLRCVIDPAPWFERFRQEALDRGDPLVRSTYHVHRDGTTLTYLRDGCPVEDIGRRFFLHVIPVAASDLPPERAVHGFDNRDFAFGARIEGNCIAIGHLPDYPIATIRTGQFTDASVHWEVEFTPDGRVALPPPSDYAAVRREALAKEPLARSGYDVYLAGRALTYLRDGCTDAEADAQFFLHVIPADEGDLPEHRREHGFDNLDFTLATHGARRDGNCVAVTHLPDYAIATVRTGQYDDTGALWTAEFALPDGE